MRSIRYRRARSVRVCYLRYVPVCVYFVICNVVLLIRKARCGVLCVCVMRLSVCVLGIQKVSVLVVVILRYLSRPVCQRVYKVFVVVRELIYHLGVRAHIYLIRYAAFFVVGVAHVLLALEVPRRREVSVFVVRIRKAVPVRVCDGGEKLTLVGIRYAPSGAVRYTRNMSGVPG